MTDIPIIFSAPMVRALLREVAEPGTGKSMTRRLAWRKPSEEFVDHVAQVGGGVPHKIDGKPSSWQRVKPGDRLWVRESVTAWERDEGLDGVGYEADGEFIPIKPTRESANAWIELNHYRGKRGAKAAAIHMPRWASRLTLVVTATKIERLQDIDEQDCEREGLYWKNGLWHRPSSESGEWHTTETAIDCWRWLWTNLHGEESWHENPEVVAIRFSVHKVNIDAMKVAA